MRIINITREGEKVTDLVGLVIPTKEGAAVYDLIRKLNTQRGGSADRDKDGDVRKSR